MITFHSTLNHFIILVSSLSCFISSFKRLVWNRGALPLTLVIFFILLRLLCAFDEFATAAVVEVARQDLNYVPLSMIPYSSSFAESSRSRSSDLDNFFFFLEDVYYFFCFYYYDYYWEHLGAEEPLDKQKFTTLFSSCFTLLSLFYYFGRA